MDLRAKHFGDIRESDRYPLLPNPAMGNTWTRIPLGVGSRKSMASSTSERSATSVVDASWDSQLQGHGAELGIKVGHGERAETFAWLPLRGKRQKSPHIQQGWHGGAAQAHVQNVG